MPQGLYRVARSSPLEELPLAPIPIEADAAILVEGYGPAPDRTEPSRKTGREARRQPRRLLAPRPRDGPGKGVLGGKEAREVLAPRLGLAEPSHELVPNP